MRHFSFPLLIHFEFGRKRRQGRSKRRTWNLIRLHVYKKGDEKKKTQQSRTRERMKVHTSSPLTVISISYSRRIARPSAHHHQTIKCIWINIGHARISRFIFDAAEYIYYKFHEFLVIRQLFWITNIYYFRHIIAYISYAALFIIYNRYFIQRRWCIVNCAALIPHDGRLKIKMGKKSVYFTVNILWI